MTTALSNLRHALRGLRKAPAHTLAVVATLAIGIGATTAIFSVVDGVLLRPAPLRDMNRLVMVWETDRKSSTTHEPASVPDYLDFQQRSRRIATFAAFSPAEASWTQDQGDPSRLVTLQVSHELLPMLGVQPLVGRTFYPDEDRPGGPNVAMIGEDLWARAFGRDDAIVGRTIRVDDEPHTIVGVLPASAAFGTLQILGAADYGRGFAEHGGSARVDLWVPLRPDPKTTPRDTHPILVLGRLAADANAHAAQQEMAGIAADLERAYPENDARGAVVEPLSQVVFGRVRPALLVLLGAVTLVLLVACANVANLMLARQAARARELGVRLALGAGARHLAGQFLAESLILALAGAGLGVMLATWGLDLLLALAPATIPRVGSVAIDGRVLGATLGVCALVGLVFGLLPTWWARRLELLSTLQSAAGHGASAGRIHRRFRSALVVSEITLTVMLMAGAGLLIRSLWRLQNVDPGFRAAGVLKAEYQLPMSRYPRRFSNWPNWTEARRFNDELCRRAAALPGVSAAAIASNHPIDAGFTSSIRVVGRENEAGDWPEPTVRLVSAGYFPTLAVPTVSGRLVAQSDDGAAPPVCVINQAARRRFFEGRNPLGQKIELWGAKRTVVGVVGDEHFHGLAQPAPPGLYLPIAQAPSASGDHTLLVRTSGDPAAVAPAVRALVRDLDPALPVFGVEPLVRTVSSTFGQRRFVVLVLVIFALVALVLAVVGVHGVLSYTVAQRTREIGIRMALGADRGRVRALVVGQGARLAAAGLALGVLGALAVTRLLSALLFGVGPGDPATFAGVALVLGAVALVATWLPAWRASRVEPMTALREE